MTIQIKAKALILEPITPAEAPNGAFFLDSTNANTATVKTTTGNAIPVGEVSASLFIKQMQAGGAIVVNRPVSKLPNGKIILADSDAVNGANLVGYAMAAAVGDGSLINVLLVGANIVGALTGLGFAPGDEIYIAENGGYTNSVNGFTGNDDSIVKVGVADCSGGAASAIANDLIIFPEIIARP